MMVMVVMSGGHYTTYVKNWKNSAWYWYDDAAGYAIPEHATQKAEAYILFYSRKTPCLDSLRKVIEQDVTPLEGLVCVM